MDNNVKNEKDYYLERHLSEEELDDNNSWKKMLHLIGDNKKVLDFGCATGYFAQLLTKRGCEVTGIEVNLKAAKIAESYCTQVIVADLDFSSLTDIVQEQKFDVAVFGDVLEHLREPWKVLEQVRQILKPEGYVVASIPNIAHGAIRLALLQGRFEYTTQGILDNTHLRFFTHKSIQELFERSGYFIDCVERTKIPVISDSDLLPHIDKNYFDIKVIQEIERDKEADTLQFIVRAYPLSLEGKYAALYQEYSKLVSEVKASNTHLEQIHSELEKSQIQLQEKETELQEKETELQEKQTELQEKETELQEKQTQLEKSQMQILQKQAELEHTQIEMQEKQISLENLQEQLQHTQTQLDGALVQLQEAHQELESSQTQLNQSQTQLQKTQTELARFQMQLPQTQTELESCETQLQQLQTQLQQAHEAWERCQNMIQAMETSKFWKIRQVWFGIKSSLGLKVN